MVDSYPSNGSIPEDSDTQFFAALLQKVAEIRGIATYNKPQEIGRQ